MSYIHKATGAAEIDAIAARAIAIGAGHTAELLLAARRGEIAVAFVVGPDTPAPMKVLKHCGRPALAVIGDDPGDAGQGPARWLATRRLVEWAGFGIIHAAGGTVDHYMQVVALTKLHRRVLLIECASCRAQEWAEAMTRGPRRLPLLGVLPRTGAHPVKEDAR